MNNLGGISLNDYAGFSVGQQFGGHYNPADVETLYKAMSAEHITGTQTWDDATVSGAGLKVESLENTLKILVNTPRHTPFFFRIGKKPATNTVEEYVQLQNYGNLDGGSTLEGELPVNADSIFVRRANLIKYFGVVGGVTHQMQLVQTGAGISNMLATETKNKVELMTKILEGYLPFADSRKVPTLFNGFMAQHEMDTGFPSYDAYQDSEVVVDLRGSVLTDTAVEQAALGIVNNFGLGDMLISSPRTFSNFVTRYHSRKWMQPVPAQIRDGVFGQRVNEIITQNGAVEIMQSNFFRFSFQKYLTTPTTSPQAPLSPIADPTTPAAAVADPYNRFANFTGDYLYAVAAKNRFGESALVPLGTGLVTVAAGNSVQLTFAPNPADPNPATCFSIYRTKVNPLSTDAYYKILEVSMTELTNGHDGAPAGSIYDRNRFLPDTDQAMLVEWDADQVLAWKQLAPMMKMNLAIIAPIMRFMVLCYGATFLYAPKKMVRFINIGNSLAGL